MKRKMVIEYHWNSDDKLEIPERDLEQLEEDAEKRIFDMIKQGYNQGELNTSTCDLDDSGKNDIGYSGWWTCKRESREQTNG